MLGDVESQFDGKERPDLQVSVAASGASVVVAEDEKDHPGSAKQFFNFTFTSGANAARELIH